MRIHTQLTGKEELTVMFIAEKEEKKNVAKQVQQIIDKNNYFTGKTGQQILLQGKTDLLILGIGELNTDNIRKTAAIAARFARDNYYQQYALDMNKKNDLVQAAIEGSLLGLYQYREYKKRSKDEAKDPSDITIITTDKRVGQAIKKGKIIAENAMLVRDLVNRPASDKNPKMIATLIKELGKKYGFDVNVLGKKELEKLGMHAMLGVNRGSDKEPQLVIVELNKNKKQVEMALVGKGVTFDAGGLQIKPGNFMVEMKSDMAGAATVLGTIISLAEQKCSKRIVGVMGFVENLVGPDAYKPGDIVTAYNSKTIEIGHTDAEGRLVLADALSFVEKNYKPQQIIDIATLTGATIIGLGHRVAALISTSKELADDLKNASDETDELVWELPLFKHYGKLMEGTIADLNNIGKKPGPYGGPGTITAAAFLSNFVEKTPWAHLDIAGTAYTYEKGNYHVEGGTGWGVNLLSTMIMKKGD